MEEFNIEDITICPDDGIYGGIATRVWYAPISYFGKLILPDEDGDYEGVKTIAKNDIALIGKKKLRCIDVFIEHNGLSEKAVGGQRKWKMVSELSLNVLGLTAKNTGFVSKNRNRPLVLIVPDSNGKVWIVGNKRNPAYLSSYEGNTGKKMADDSVVSVDFTANTELYCYEGNVMDIKSIGAFSSGYSQGYRV